MAGTGSATTPAQSHWNNHRRGFLRCQSATHTPQRSSLRWVHCSPQTRMPDSPGADPGPDGQAHITALSSTPAARRALDQQTRRAEALCSDACHSDTPKKLPMIRIRQCHPNRARCAVRYVSAKPRSARKMAVQPKGSNSAKWSKRALMANR